MDNLPVNKASLRLTIVVSFCYLAILVLLSIHHEMWRDEVRALSIATSSPSFFGVIANLKNEGHPILWYFLLYLAHSIYPSPLVLPIVSIIVATLAGAVFFRFAPFPTPIKLIWLLGFYPIYEYSVSSRNYGIGMLLLWLYLAAFPQRLKKPYLVTLLLLLLANANLYSFLISIALSLSLLAEVLLNKKDPPVTKAKPFLVSGFILFTGLIVSAISMKPDSSSEVFSFSWQNIASIKSTLLVSLASLGSPFHNALYLPFPWAVPIIIITLVLLFIRTPSTIVFLLSTTFAMELVHRLIYSGLALRHQGHLLLAIIAAVWMDSCKRPEILKNNDRLQNFESRRQHLLLFILTLLLLVQLYSGAKAVRQDLIHPLSSAINVAKFINENSTLSNAIIMAEPDYTAEALPYYLNNPLYFSRENSFKKTVSFTDLANLKYSLSSLVKDASRLAEVEHKNIILLLPPEMSPGDEIKSLYERSFFVDAIGLSELKQRFRLLKTFSGAVSDENYSLWFLEIP